MKGLTISISLFVFILLLAAGCPQQQAPPQPPVQPPTTTPPNETGSGGPGITERPDYLNETWFANLPPFPKDLYKLRNQIKYGEFWDMASIGEEYYRQPEFYPTFEIIGVPSLQKRSGMSPYGFGTYPADIQVITFAGDNITVATFFFTSWGVETYQGMGLAAKATDMNKTPVDYIWAELEPRAIVLGSTYPVFESNWAEKVVVTIHVAKDAPVGTYYLNVDPTEVPADKGAEWSTQYGGRYTEGGMFKTAMDRPYFIVTIAVT